jgi:hypothetical protein
MHPQPPLPRLKNAFSAPRALVATVLALCTLLLPGCENTPLPDKGANQSLVGIGEQLLDRAESLENNNRSGEANATYRRALWAFTYHQQLTGEAPLLLDDARNGIERTGTQQ